MFAKLSNYCGQRNVRFGGIHSFAVKVCPDTAGDVGVFLGPKLHFHQYAEYLFPYPMNLFDLIRTITFSISSLECFAVVHQPSKRKHEYAFVV
jgi:hypothetical protein